MKLQQKERNKLKMEKCFGFKNGECKILYVSTCDGYQSSCHFHKSKNEFDMNRASSFKHINSLPNIEQDKIANAYYGGNKPWKL